MSVETPQPGDRVRVTIEGTAKDYDHNGKLLTMSRGEDISQITYRVNHHSTTVEILERPRRRLKPGDILAAAGLPGVMVITENGYYDTSDGEFVEHDVNEPDYIGVAWRLVNP